MGGNHNGGIYLYFFFYIADISYGHLYIFFCFCYMEDQSKTGKDAFQNQKINSEDLIVKSHLKPKAHENKKDAL